MGEFLDIPAEPEQTRLLRQVLFAAEKYAALDASRHTSVESLRTAKEHLTAAQEAYYKFACPV
jgi:hypothetical protein